MLSCVFLPLQLEVLSALGQLELNFLTVSKAFKAITFNGTKVDEDIFGAIWHRNEAKSLCIVEPLYGADTSI